MASATSIYGMAAKPRGRSFFVPREHGAWGMLLVPLLVGASVGNLRGERFIWIFLFALAALSLFCLRTPVEAAFGVSALRAQNDGERRLVHTFIFLYSSAAIVALSILIFRVHAYGLLLLGAAAAVAFVLQAILRMLGRNTRMNSQLAGSIALSSTAAGAYYLATGHFDFTAGIVWFANWIFSADQIHFVQLRIHSARAATFEAKLNLGQGFLVHQILSLILLLAVWRAGWVPGLAVVAFAPLFIRGLAWFLEAQHPLQVRRLGFSELIYAVLFGIFFITGFHS